MLFSFWKSIVEPLNDPIVVFTALTAIGAIVAAIAAVRANAPNSREKTDILKCEILNFIRNPIGLQVWVRFASLGEANPTSMAELLDIERSRQMGLWGKIVKSRKYSKYKWAVDIIAAMSELQKEGHKSVSIGMTPITSEDISQWNYKQSVAMFSALGVPQEEIDKYLIRNWF